MTTTTDANIGAEVRHVSKPVRPMLRQATLADFISLNSFAPLRASSEAPISCVIDNHTEDLIAAAVEAVKVRVAIDSAAVDNVINPSALPSDVTYIPNTTGRHFVGANDAHIEKYGSCGTIFTS